MKLSTAARPLPVVPHVPPLPPPPPLPTRKQEPAFQPQNDTQWQNLSFELLSAPIASNDNRQNDIKDVEARNNMIKNVLHVVNDSTRHPSQEYNFSSNHRSVNHATFFHCPPCPPPFQPQPPPLLSPFTTAHCQHNFDCKSSGQSAQHLMHSNYSKPPITLHRDLLSNEAVALKTQMLHKDESQSQCQRSQINASKPPPPPPRQNNHHDKETKNNTSTSRNSPHRENFTIGESELDMDTKCQSSPSSPTAEQSHHNQSATALHLPSSDHKNQYTIYGNSRVVTRR